VKKASEVQVLSDTLAQAQEALAAAQEAVKLSRSEALKTGDMRLVRDAREAEELAEMKVNAAQLALQEHEAAELDRYRGELRQERDAAVARLEASQYSTLPEEVLAKIFEYVEVLEREYAERLRLYQRACEITSALGERDDRVSPYLAQQPSPAVSAQVPELNTQVFGFDYPRRQKNKQVTAQAVLTQLFGKQNALLNYNH
jgi:hypothetical protein